MALPRTAARRTSHACIPTEGKGRPATGRAAVTQCRPAPVILSERHALQEKHTLGSTCYASIDAALTELSARPPLLNLAAPNASSGQSSRLDIHCTKVVLQQNPVLPPGDAALNLAD